MEACTMADARLKLTSTSGDGKLLEITSGGPQYAKITFSPNQNGDLDLMDDDELRILLSKKVLPAAILKAPEFTLSSNTLIENYNGDFTFKEYTVSGVSGAITKFSTYFEISTSNTFIDTTFSLLKEGNNIQSLLNTDLVNTGLLVNTVYYIRARVYINNSVSEWSNVLRFTIAGHRYQQPVINNISLHQEDSKVIKGDGDKRYTGYIDFDLATYQVATGTPGDPNEIDIAITTELIGGDSNIFNIYTYSLSSFKFSLYMVPFRLFPTEETKYLFKVRYRNTKTNTVSDWSDITKLSVPVARAFPKELFIDNDSNTIVSNPTIGIKNLEFDYDFFDKFDQISFLNNVNAFTAGKGKGDDALQEKYNTAYTNSIATMAASSTFKYCFSIKYNNEQVYTYTIERLKDEVLGKYYKGCMFSLTDYSMKPSSVYEIGFGLEWRYKDSDGDKVVNYGTISPDVTPSYPILVSDSITTGSNVIIIPTDDLSKINKTFDRFGYYGEVTSNKLVPYQVDFKGKLQLNVEYPVYSEVEYNGELYLNVNNTSTLTSYDNLENFVKITKDNVSDYYKSQLPTGKWLIERLGIPTDLTETSNVVNSMEGWIKCHNRANQIVYIAKKPFMTNIEYKYLKERFLNGHGSRTIRIGLNLYNVRLLEYNPTSWMLDRYNIKSNSTGNIEDEINLYSALYNYFNYDQDGLGITDESAIVYSANGYINVKSSSTGVNVNTGSLANNSDIIKDAKMKMYRPVLELVYTGYEPWRKYTPELKYDYITDTGYFGKVTEHDLLNTSELMKLTNLSTLNPTNTDPIYYKFYYHGMIVYIPTSPLGNNVDYNTLYSLGLHNGIDIEAKSVNGKKTRFMLPNITSDIEITTETYEGEIHGNYTYPNKDNVVKDLLSRVITNLPSEITSTMDRWEDDTMDGIENVIFRDGVYRRIKEEYRDELYYTLGIDKTEEDMLKITHRYLATTGNYLPVIVQEAYDLNTNLTYTDVIAKKPNISYTTVNVNRYKIVPQEVTKTREVQKQKIVEAEKTISYKEKVYTGKLSFPSMDRDSGKDIFGTLLFCCSKDDTAYFGEELYKRKQLNVTLSSNALKLRYSTKFPSIESFIAKSCMVLGNTVGKLTTEPLHIAKFFNSSESAKEFINLIVNPDVKFVSLKNNAYNKVMTDPAKTLPLGMFLGKLSSLYMYYPVNPMFNLSNPTYDLKIDLNLSPRITIDGNNYNNSWSKVEDLTGKRCIVPILNSYLDYNNYSPYGKKLIDNYLIYLNQQTDIDIDIYKSDYAFGVLVTDLATLSYLSDNGIIGGDKTTPVIRNYPDTYELPKYIGNKSTDKDYLDIMNPVKEYTEVIKTEVVKYDKLVTYQDVEEYTDIEYIKVPFTERVRVQKVSYE